MGRNVKDGSQFVAGIMRDARQACLENTQGICPACEGEFAIGASAVIDHMLPFKLRQFAGDCGLDFIGQRENAMYICSGCNESKSKREQRAVECLKAGNVDEARERAVGIFTLAVTNKDKRMGKLALANRKTNMRQIETSTRDKKAATKKVTAAKHADDPKALVRAKREEFGIAHRRANERRAMKRRKVVNF
jgi:hypothetical protein